MASKAKEIDFSGVKDRGNFNTKRVPEGDYAAIIVKVEDAESKKDGEFQYLFTIKLKKYSQHAYPYYCKLTENQLWKLRNILVAAGINVPKKRLKVDPNRVVGKEIGVTMSDEEYDGKEKSVIDSVFPVSELSDLAEPSDDADDDASDDEAPAAESKAEKKGKKGKKDKGKKKKDAENTEELDLDEIG